jgi:Trp operon repressor
MQVKASRFTIEEKNGLKERQLFSLLLSLLLTKKEKKRRVRNLFAVSEVTLGKKMQRQIERRGSFNQ